MWIIFFFFLNLVGWLVGFQWKDLFGGVCLYLGIQVGRSASLLVSQLKQRLHSKFTFIKPPSNILPAIAAVSQNTFLKICQAENALCFLPISSKFQGKCTAMKQRMVTSSRSPGRKSRRNLETLKPWNLELMLQILKSSCKKSWCPARAQCLDFLFLFGP